MEGGRVVVGPLGSLRLVRSPAMASNSVDCISSSGEGQVVSAAFMEVDVPGAVGGVGRQGRGRT